MLSRRLLHDVVRALDRQPAVCLLGPRQVGKTTLALEVAAGRPSVYVDLERPADRAKLEEPEPFLAAHADELVVLDEVQAVPGLFGLLRGRIDALRREGRGTGRFLLLGSASVELIRQTPESLAGRITYLELSPLDVTEFGDTDDDLTRLWVRGGFPESTLAADDDASFEWRTSFIRTYLERDVPQLGPRVPAETLHRLWTMLAHGQGATLNASRLASALGLSGRTVGRYLDLMVDLLLVRRLQPWAGNVGKRLVRSPKIYVRDSGLLHALLALRDLDALLGHPVVGASWEGMVVETLVGLARGAQPFFYRTSAGAELDLLLELPGGARWAFEVKRSLAPKPARGFHSACEDVKPERRLLVYPGTDLFPTTGGVEVMGLLDAAQAVQEACGR